MSIKLNPIMLVLGSLAAIVGGWGLYTMMTRIGGAPPFIGIITIAILELFAVGLGIHAVKVARDGDSPFPFNLGITLIALVAAAVQFAAAIEEGKGVLFGTVMAMAPIAAITLWVVEVRRMFRLQGRAAGTVAQPAATIEPALWLRFFKQAWTAKTFALIDRSLGADDAMKLGILHTQPKPKALVAPVCRDRGIAVEDVLPQLRSLTASATATAPTEGSQEQTTTGGFASVDFPATETSSPNGHHGYDPTGAFNGTAPYGLR
jgi:hypothetical protein